MASQELERARCFEAREEGRIRQMDRPVFHLSPRVGWMNDPNGFSFYRGLYHIFYQYHPYASHWGPMHWGHAVSGDLLRWTAMPCAMAPDRPFDQNGCFSGSAVTLPDGRQLLMYTGVGEGGVQIQCLAVGDGTEYEKLPTNPVIDASMLPEGASRMDFRDPHIWQEACGSFRAVVGNLTGSGQTERAKFFHFSSPDGFSWKCEGVFAENTLRLGRMWECPDVFTLDGKTVVLASTTEMEPRVIAALDEGIPGVSPEEGGSARPKEQEGGPEGAPEKLPEEGGSSQSKEQEGGHEGTPEKLPEEGGSAQPKGQEESYESAPGGMPKENGNFCLIGRTDPKTGAFLAEKAVALEYGIDFYAAQTLLSPDGRRILIAWMQSWDTLAPEFRDRPFFGQMTLPRELSIRNGRLCQMPIRELLAFRQNEVTRRNVVLEDGELELHGIRGRVLDLEITLHLGGTQTGPTEQNGPSGQTGPTEQTEPSGQLGPTERTEPSEQTRQEMQIGGDGQASWKNQTVMAESSGKGLRHFSLAFAKNEQYETVLSFDPSKSTLVLDRSRSGFPQGVKNVCRAKVSPSGGKLRLRIILDRQSAEVFVGEGEQAMTITYYTDPSADRIAFSAEGRALFDVRKFALAV